MTTCDIDDNPLSDAMADSGCEDNGTAYMCSDQSPWVVDDNLSYGFAAVKLSGQTEEQWCCACYELTFTSGPASGKKMVVQATNTGADLGSNHFDIAVCMNSNSLTHSLHTYKTATTDLHDSPFRLTDLSIDARRRRGHL